MTNSAYKTKKDLVVEIIREAILSGELKPGERLLQGELAERLDVSPTPIREALRELEAEGILDHSPHKGVRVAEVKPEDVREIYLIRGVLEALATRLAVPRFDSSTIQRLDALQAQIEAYIEEGQLRELRKLNYELHMLIYQVAGLSELLRIIRSLWSKFPWDTLHVLPGRAAESAEEHRELIRAIKGGDAQLAGQRMQAHIENGSRALIEYLASVGQADMADTSAET